MASSNLNPPQSNEVRENIESHSRETLAPSVQDNNSPSMNSVTSISSLTELNTNDSLSGINTNGSSSTIPNDNNESPPAMINSISTNIPHPPMLNNIYPPPMPTNNPHPVMYNVPPLGLSLPDMPPPYEDIVHQIDAGASNFNSDGPTIQPPSYEEVQQQKALEAGIEYPVPLNLDTSGPGMQVVHLSTLGGQTSMTPDAIEEQLLGTDLMFLAAFTGTFVFNWVALILFLCFCRTIAGRTGSLAGFGLSSSLAVIFRYPHNLGSNKNAWLLWIILILGLLISVRAILQYATAKRNWQQLHQNTGPRFSFIC